jgi:non-canonical (house-cleaning) NTP pyrophosphatase
MQQKYRVNLFHTGDVYFTIIASTKTEAKKKALTKFYKTPVRQLTQVDVISADNEKDIQKQKRKQEEVKQILKRRYENN